MTATALLAWAIACASSAPLDSNAELRLGWTLPPDTMRELAALAGLPLETDLISVLGQPRIALRLTWKIGTLTVSASGSRPVEAADLMRFVDGRAA